MEELRQERSVSVDHSTINRWVRKYSPQLEEAVHRRKRLVLEILCPDPRGQKINLAAMHLTRDTTCGSPKHPIIVDTEV